MPASNDELYGEILRARDRLHSLETRVTTLEIQGKVHGQALERVEQRVGELPQPDAIAEAVAQRMRGTGTLHLSQSQRRAVLGVVGIVLANLILRLAGVEGVS